MTRYALSCGEIIMARILEVEWDHVDAPQIIFNESRVKLRLPQAQSMEAVGRYVTYARAISFDIVKTDRTLKGYFSGEGIILVPPDDGDREGFVSPLSYTFDKLDEMVKREMEGEMSPPET
jgi:hypothetical protein